MARNRANDPGARFDAYRVDPSKLVIIGLDTNDDGDHPLYDERIKFKVNEALVRNIKHNGVMMTVLVRRNGPSFEVIDGRQRVRAAREATKRMQAEGLLTDDQCILVPCHLRKDDETSLAVAVVSTNELRQEDTPMNRARKALRLQKLGQDYDQIAEAFNVSIQTAKNWLKLFDLTPAIQKAVEFGKISASAAAPLTAFKLEEQDAKLQEILESAPAGAPKSEKLTRARVQKAVDPDAVHAPGKSALKRLLKDEPSLQTLSDQEVELIRYFATGVTLDQPCESIVNIKDLVEAFGG
tara:strand:- start:4647 stop:5534 length:888 start_codon:yes stop_codon:yes gene_type:complete